VSPALRAAGRRGAVVLVGIGVGLGAPAAGAQGPNAGLQDLYRQFPLDPGPRVAESPPPPPVPRPAPPPGGGDGSFPVWPVVGGVAGGVALGMAGVGLGARRRRATRPPALPPGRVVARPMRELPAAGPAVVGRRPAPIAATAPPRPDPLLAARALEARIRPPAPSPPAVRGGRPAPVATAAPPPPDPSDPAIPGGHPRRRLARAEAVRAAAVRRAARAKETAAMAAAPAVLWVLDRTVRFLGEPPPPDRAPAREPGNGNGAG
jgi:hypothetical protein